MQEKPAAELTQEAPFIQGEEPHESKRISHFWPEYEAAHVHANPAVELEHVAPFMHGELAQLSYKSSQFVLKYPEGHEHM